MFVFRYLCSACAFGGDNFVRIRKNFGLKVKFLDYMCDFFDIGICNLERTFNDHIAAQ